MNGNNNNGRRLKPEEIAVGVVAGAAAVYGTYKLLDSIFGSKKPKANYDRPSHQASIGYNHIEDHFSKQGIYVVANAAQLHNALQELKSDFSESKVIGFDCEWESSYQGRQKVAILQLCSHSGECVIVQLSQFNQFPSELRALLEDSSIIKVGVAPYTDAKFLYDDYGVRVASTLDLRYMAEEAGCRPAGLKKMTANYLGDHGFILDENEQCSDWENPNLSNEQIEYAASDVLAAIHLCKHFARGMTKPRVAKMDNTIKNRCSKYINKNYGPQQ